MSNWLICIHLNRDAAWETEGGAFSELYERYSHCDAAVCKNPEGRENCIDFDPCALALFIFTYYAIMICLFS